MNKSLADKIVLPEFPDDVEFDELGYMIEVRETTKDFFFEVCIYEDDEYMSGFISTTLFYDDSIVVAKDYYIPYTKDCTPNKSECRKAYKKIVTELRKEYKQWVMDNILFEE